VSVNKATAIHFKNVNFGHGRVRGLFEEMRKFTTGMGMTIAACGRTSGHSSWTYSALLEDGKTRTLFAERRTMDDLPVGVFEVSDAVTMVDYLRAEAIRLETRKGVHRSIHGQAC
jgi:peroxiredoxin